MIAITVSISMSVKPLESLREPMTPALLWQPKNLMYTRFTLVKGTDSSRQSGKPGMAPEISLSATPD
jgi:hypothetical protein